MQGRRRLWLVALVGVIATLLVGAAVWPQTPTRPDTTPQPTVTPQPTTTHPRSAAVEGPYDPTFETTVEDGVARVGGEEYESLRAALDAADAGDTVTLSGRVRGPVTIRTPNLTVRSTTGTRAVVEGGGNGSVVTVRSRNVTLRRVWIRSSGRDVAAGDAGIAVFSPDVSILGSRLTNVTYGVWADYADGLLVTRTTVVGYERPVDANRGDGVRLWRTDGARIVDNRITDVRDGVQYAWVTGGVTRDNAVWDLRYGFNLFYSENHTFRDNLAVDNDVGLVALQARHLSVIGTQFVNNTGQSGHGILFNAVSRSRISRNELRANEDGLYVDNCVNLVVAENLLAENDVGFVYDAAPSQVRNNVVRDNRVGVLLVKPLHEGQIERLHEHNQFLDNRDPIGITEW